MHEEMAVWVVSAEEACESSGGSVTLLIVTTSAAEVPDVVAAFTRQRQRASCELYAINKIELLGSFPVEGMLLIDPGGK